MRDPFVAEPQHRSTSTRSCTTAAVTAGWSFLGAPRIRICYLFVAALVDPQRHQLSELNHRCDPRFFAWPTSFEWQVGQTL